MPILMPLSFILVISLCISSASQKDTIFYLRLIAAILMGSMIATTVLVNVPVNIATGNWNSTDDKEKWIKKRKVWRFFQGYRSIILVVCFLLILISVMSAK